MKNYYAYIQNNQIVGTGCCLIVNLTNLEISEKIYENIEKYMYNGENIVIDPDYKAKQKKNEKEKIKLLSLTSADVERAIYKAKGMDFDDIVGLVQKYNQKLETLKSDYAQKLAQYNGLTPEMQAQQEKPIEPEGSFIDVKVLKIELKANNFYRGNPYVEQIGVLLGYSPEDLDYLFLNNELPEKEVKE